MAAGPSPACGARQACADSWSKLICWCDDFARHRIDFPQTRRARRLAPARTLLRLLAGARIVDGGVDGIHPRLYVSRPSRSTPEHSAVFTAGVAALAGLLGRFRRVCDGQLAPWWTDVGHAAVAPAS